jgi:hypothetical protein
MKMLSGVACAMLLFVGCGGQPSETASSPESASPAEPAAPSPGTGTPCAPLDSAMARLDNRGTPLLFSLEAPRDFVPNLSAAGPSVILDLKASHGKDETVLRFHQTTRGDNHRDHAPMLNSWRTSPYLEEILEVDIGGETMFVMRSRRDDLVEFQALFPSFDQPGNSHLLVGGVHKAPKDCMEQAYEMIEKMFRSFERNREIGDALQVSAR